MTSNYQFLPGVINTIRLMTSWYDFKTEKIVLGLMNPKYDSTRLNTAGVAIEDLFTSTVLIRGVKSVPIYERKTKTLKEPLDLADVSKI
jgi:hypothetical protein